MPFNMKSKAALFVLAILWGIANSAEWLIAGAPTKVFLFFFLGSAFLGTLMLAGIIWLVLLVIRKRHLQIAVLNWAMLVGIVLRGGLIIIIANGGADRLASFL
ncbi:hypothetical protein [Thalassovita sp.]|uniref:hypothetical protein n=1 Tax=Thalassovita sp. TaxID=1979401 RepID=UPI0029DE8EFF|nr:hypothetical protein [Thalassovita sp.]